MCLCTLSGRTRQEEEIIGSTQYTEARSLVRRIRRPRGESRRQFKSNVLLLRRHFEQFNVDASEICQWLMGIRPGGRHADESTGPFWEFFLDPGRFLRETGRGPEDADERIDAYRRIAFDVVAGIEDESRMSDPSIPRQIVESLHAVSMATRTESARRLFERLAGLEPSHRQILLKAAAEWIVSRYWRSVQGWPDRYKHWSDEKEEWEKAHPRLTESLREEFTGIFRDLGIRRKKPRVCPWERLEKGMDNCMYAGERIKVGYSRQSHSQLCAKYERFSYKQRQRTKSGKNFKSYFVKNAELYLKLRRKNRSLIKKDVMKLFRKKVPQALWFEKAWDEYLKALGVDEATLTKDGKLPHCTQFADDKECLFNRHTELCLQYRERLLRLPHLQELEQLYREWRDKYLSGPRRPSLRYPSKRTLPMPKVFGRGYFCADFTNSLLDLRLEGMGEGDFVRFGFAPWPADYDAQPSDATVTSVHIHFVGTRARAGFRFQAPHKTSRFASSQDEIDDLRSRKFPRAAQDGEFLDAARKLLLESFTGDAEREMKLLAVDLGDRGAGAAVFEGRCFKEAMPLKIIKTDTLIDKPPPVTKTPRKGKPGKRESKRARGLDKYHVARHLDTWRKGARKIAERRAKGEADPVKLGAHDMRSLSLHVRWMIRDWVRLNASQIIKTAESHKTDLIVLESLRGFSAPGYHKLDDEKKRTLAFFAYGRIRRKLTEKAVERGMRVVVAPYLRSSQVCAECGREQIDRNKLMKDKRKRRFICEYSDCTWQCDSDQNAACVLGRVFWGEIELPSERKKD